MMDLVSADQLTGAYVRQVRESRKITRKTFSEMCGFTTPSRLISIETRESWKSGEKDIILDVLKMLEGDDANSSGNVDNVSAGTSLVVTSPPSSDNGGGDDTTTTTTTTINVVDADWPFGDDDDDYLNFAYLLDGDPSSNGLVRQSFTGGLALVEPMPLQLPELDLTSALDVPDGTYLLTNSEFTTKLRCPRKWWLSYYRRLALKSRDYSGPLAKGDRVHRALACWYVPDGKPRIDPRTALEAIIAEDWQSLSEQVRAKSPDEDEEALGKLAQKFNDSCSLERIMIEGYMEWIEETGTDSEYRIIGPEQVIWWDTEVPIEDFEGNSGNFPGTPVRVIGKLDAQIERISDNVRMLMDHKTTPDMKALQKTLHGNPQSLTYLLLQWLGTPAGETYCNTALWNMLKKVKRTERAKPPFYERVEVSYNEHELESHKKALLAVSRDILRIREELNVGADHHSVVPKNWIKDCDWDCDFLPICPLFDDGSRVEDAITNLYRQVDPLARYKTELI
jgi:hypothetical protein